MLRQLDLMRLDSDVYAGRWSLISRKVLICIVIGVVLNGLMMGRNFPGVLSSVSTKSTHTHLRISQGTRPSVLLPTQHAYAIHQSQRAQILACFERLFQTTRQQYIQNANLSIPVLHSVRTNPTNLSELVLFVVLGHDVNMREPGFTIFKDGVYWCDDDRTPARVVRHDRKFLSQIKMYCPVGTERLSFDTDDPELRRQLTFDLRPFVACGDGQSLLPPNAAQSKIAACTAVKGKAAYDLVPQWIEYHRMIGVDTFWIHVNDPLDRMVDEAPDVVRYMQRPDVQGYAGVFPYEWAVDDVEPFFAQRAVYHDCLQHAMRNNVTWVLLSDVDELVHVVQPNTTLNELIRPYEDDQQLGALSLRNMFYGVKGNGTVYDYTKPRLMLRDFVYRGVEPSHTSRRSKMLVRPSRVEYLMIHAIDKDGMGGRTVHMDPFGQVRLNHYKQTGGCQRPVRDTQLADAFTTRMEERMIQVYHPQDPAQFYPTVVEAVEDGWFNACPLK